MKKKIGNTNLLLDWMAINNQMDGEYNSESLDIHSFKPNTRNFPC